MRFDYESFASRAKSKLYRYIHKPHTTNTTLIRTDDVPLEQVIFNRFVFNNNEGKPVIFLSSLIEFGCESLLPHYFLNSFKEKYSNYHRVAITWSGRRSLYMKHMDEVWELDDKFQNLRDLSLAFHVIGKNLLNIEKSLLNHGEVFQSKLIANTFLETRCKSCGYLFPSQDFAIECERCNSNNLIQSMICEPKKHKDNYCFFDFDFTKYESLLETFKKDKKYIGIFARHRKTYGRNLTAKFYIDLVKSLKEKGYDVIWLGENQNTLECPCEVAFDMTKSDFSNDVSFCVGLASKCHATFQAWTASTRFSMWAKKPFFLVESHDQLYGKGHEGKRIALLDHEEVKNKILIYNFYEASKNLNGFTEYTISHFLDFIENIN